MALGGEGSVPRSESSSAMDFWIFLLLDIFFFLALFASYAVLSCRQTVWGPSGREPSELRHVGI